MADVFGYTLDQNAVYLIAAILVLKAVDVVLGVLGALQHGTFDVRRLPTYLSSTVLGLIVPVVLLAMVSDLHVGLQAAFYVSAVFVILKLIADLRDKVGRLGPQGR